MSRPAVALVPDADAAPAPVRVATYTRISTDEERQPNSLEAQAHRLAAFVDSQPGWRIERRYQDQFTGTVLERPALTRLLRDAKLARFDLLLVYRVDRLARSIRGLAQIIDELAACEVVFRSATEPFDTGTPAGRMMMQMLGVFAEFERALIVERIVAGQERKAARGGWLGGTRPYGYQLATDREHLEPQPTEAPLVPRIFELYAHRRLGSAAIAAWLNERGYRTARGGPWSPDGVLRVIRNRSYLGQIYYRGHWYDAPHQPLVDGQLFEKAQRLLTRRSEDVSTRRANASDYLLSGSIRCGRCGQAYIGTAAHGRHQRYTYYTCLTRVRYGTRQCANDRLPADKLEAAVLGRLRDVLADQRLLGRAVERAYQRILTEQPRHQHERAGRPRREAARDPSRARTLFRSVRARQPARRRLRPTHQRTHRPSASARAAPRRTRPGSRRRRQAREDPPRGHRRPTRRARTGARPGAAPPAQGDPPTAHRRDHRRIAGRHPTHLPRTRGSTSASDDGASRTQVEPLGSAPWRSALDLRSGD